MRICEKRRKTAETDIELKLNLDGQGVFNISSGNGFFDHMLKLFTMHGKFDMDLKCDGDTEVDFHHSAEDIGIVLGEAVKDALCDKAGIARYADIILPMDEALILCAVDISGRSYLNYKVSLGRLAYPIRQRRAYLWWERLIPSLWKNFLQHLFGHRELRCTLFNLKEKTLTTL